MRETDISLRSNTPLTDMSNVEYLLKQEMADSMIGIQHSRSLGKTPNALHDRYDGLARMLRSILLAKGRESYIKMRDLSFFPADHYNLKDCEYDGSRSLLEIVESFHRTAAVPTVE